MNKIIKLYYHLTAYVPRKLPASESDFYYFKWVMQHAYGVFDEPSSWAQMSGAIGARKGDHIRAPWGRIANIAKRVRINSIAHSFKVKSIEEMQARLETLKQEELAKSGLAKEETQPLES